MNTKMFQKTPYIVVTATLLIAVAGSLLLADKQIRMSNVQSCLNLSQNRTTTTGTSGNNGQWNVEESTINTSLYQECLSKKHL